ncbi:MAG: helix-turn-helix domain-containing protein [Clostridiales bacterium]|nr:helix-turn-helix domain-containing protein [Clostridiales bacterium]
MVNLGKRIRALRLEKHITQTEMAQRIGISKAMISAYELEQRQPSYDILIRIATFFKVSADYLLGLEKSEMIDISGLKEREIEAIRNMIDVLHSKD